ncbi:MAG: tRNA (guanosine(37)-N1)-methyltransferase TrmD [Thermoanaerobaculales bacterium]
MHFDILTIFPELFETFRATGVLGKAVDRGVVGLDVHDLRDWADNRWRQLDDEPYGGGAGMVLQAPPVLAALRELRERGPTPRCIVLGPRGRVLDQTLAEELTAEKRLLLLCGRYEGFDERVFEVLELEEISLGDFILGGGEVAAMAVVEVVARLVPGVVGDPNSVAEDSFAGGLLDFPCYTRPADVEGRKVPEVLRSGHHEAIRRWRLERAVQATVTRRPDMVKKNWSRYPEEVRRLIRGIAPGLAPGRGDDEVTRSRSPEVGECREKH